MVPMSSDEMQRYKSFRGVGSQILSKRKRGRSIEPADDPEMKPSPAKKLGGDVEVVVGHCELAES
jgi:mRNA (guanine-N7-)-methyltransferase